MADYDPTAPFTFDATDGTYQNGNEYQDDHQEAGEEDDDYDPSSFNFGDDEGDAEVTEEVDDILTDEAPPAQTEQSSKPKTLGGFIVEDDEEEDEEQDAVPPPSQMNGTEDAQSGLGAVAVSEVQDVPVASEPQDTAAAVQSAQSADLNGSMPVVPVSEVPAPSATLPAPSQPLQSPDQGKALANLSATASASQSTTATPQPPASTSAVAAPPLTNGSVPQTPTTQRLPHDRVGQLEDRIKEDPKADTEAWRSLIAHYREKGQVDNVRKVYSRFCEVFRTAVCTISQRPLALCSLLK